MLPNGRCCLNLRRCSVLEVMPDRDVSSVKKQKTKLIDFNSYVIFFHPDLKTTKTQTKNKVTVQLMQKIQVLVQEASRVVQFC